MGREPPEAVATTFLERFGDGEFDEADDLIHPEGPLEGAGDAAMIFSLILTDVLATLVLGAIPIAVTETAIVEESPTKASVEASLDVAGVAEIDALVELRPCDDDERDLGDGRRDGWCVWSVDTDL
ncbi:MULTISPECIES: hypothetical protein [Halorussus]|uniref:hypothetical protein n=1 Tax=Halorussus TaxID=1070314 RepID=UPI000E214E55|nr:MULTISPECIES: hypothetical protein [Halorussus]NHN60751.1 hypothetical protein [Halorussus sp. JP-T4]